jgi:DNA-binding beta-propeller fold protein YncE
MRPLAPCLLTLLLSAPASAQIAVSANDAKVTLVDGVTTPVRNPPPDTVTVVDLSVSPPKVIAELQAPTSVVGPPESVAIAPDNSIALVTASTKIDPADPTRTIADNRVSVIDLQAKPPAVIATLQAGSGASGVSFNPTGSLAIVANRMEGTLSVFTVTGKTVTASGKVDLGAPDSGPSHVAFTRDGRRALVTRNNDSLISVLAIDGATATYTKRDFAGGLKPYSIVVSPTEDVAVVGHVGAGPTGGADTIGIVDLSVDPPRVTDQIAAGPTIEGVAMSADGRLIAVTVMNNSNAPKASPLYKEGGLVRVLRLAKKTLSPVAEAPVGKWCQGAAWSRDSRTLVVQCMLERELVVFSFDGTRLSRAGAIKVNGGPAGMRTGSLIPNP